MLKIGQICTRCIKPFGSSVSDGAAIDSLKKNYSKKKAIGRVMESLMKIGSQRELVTFLVLLGYEPTYAYANFYD